MKNAYQLLARARQITENKNSGVNIGKMADMAGIKDGTLRRLLKVGQKHNTLEMLGALEEVVKKIEAELAKKSKSE